MMRYKLVLSKKRPPWWKEGDPTEYIMEKGKYIRELDLVTKDLPKDLVDRMYECLECRLHQKLGSAASRSADLRISRPIGADKHLLLENGCRIIPVA